jgi:hypothetical protein
VRVERITESTGIQLAGWAGVPVACALVLWLLLPEPWATACALGVLVAGLVLVSLAHGDRFGVTVSADRVRLVGTGPDTTFERAEITAVFVERGQLVLLGEDVELARQPSQLDVQALADVFTRHGYPWRTRAPVR